MGQLLLVWRLVLRDVRRRPGEALMFLVVVTAAITTLTLGVATTNSVETAYAKTHSATAGPDVIAETTSSNPAELAEHLAGDPGVAAHAGPFFAFDSMIRANSQTARSAVEGRDSQPSAVDQPLVTSGSWVRPGGAVIERGFAQTLGVRVGDTLTIGGHGIPVVGIAISAATAVYPWADSAQGPGPADWGGKIWLTTADANAMAGKSLSVHMIYLKLSDPAAADQYIHSVRTPELRAQIWFALRTWQDVIRTDKAMIAYTRPTLVVGGWLLAVAALVTLAALAAVRAGRDNRRAGLLKAVGAGPGTVVAVLLAHYLLLTALATALGLTAGALLAPDLVDPSAGLLNTVSPPAADTVVTAICLAIVIALAGTVAPGLRAARVSTVHALADSAHLISHHPWLTAATAYLPTSLLLGIRLLVRRPGRAVLTALSTAATSVMVTALLTFRALSATVAQSTPLEVRDDQTGKVLLGVTLLLLVLSTLNTVLLARSSAVQAQPTLTIARTLGATPGQVVTALCAAQLLPAVPGLLTGIPIGLGLYSLFSMAMVIPPATWLLAAVLATLLGITVLTAVPAWTHTRRPAGSILHTEAA